MTAKITKDLLIEMASTLWKHTQGAVDSDDVLLELFQGPDALVGESPAFRLMVDGMMGMPDGQVTVLALPRWAHHGFPQVELSHTYAAALMATSVSKEALEYVRAPYTSFMIRVPDDMLFCVDNRPDEGSNDLVPIRRILVAKFNHRKGDTWAYIAFTDTTVSMWRHGVLVDELLPPTLTDITPGELQYLDSYGLDLTDQDQRVFVLIGRLIVNVCLAMMDPTRFKESGSMHRTQRERRRKGYRPLPHLRHIKVGHRLEVDLRPEIRMFVLGEKKALESSHIVSGHHKMQPHGPESSLRKLIWVEPYRRGPLAELATPRAEVSNAS